MLNTYSAALVITALVSAVSVAGCSSSDANNRMEPTNRATSPGDANIVPREAVTDEIRPIGADGSLIDFAETKYADGNPTHYADNSPAYHADGRAIDYRPRNIQRELRDMPTLFIRDVGQQRLGVEGDAARPKLVYLAAVDAARVEIRGDPNVVWRDPASGDVCWRSLTCTHTDCSTPAGPLIFAAAVPGLTNDLEGPMSLKRCPRCGRRDTVTRYIPAVTSERITSLRMKLDRLRSGRRGE